LSSRITIAKALGRLSPDSATSHYSCTLQSRFQICKRQVLFGRARAGKAKEKTHNKQTTEILKTTVLIVTNQGKPSFLLGALSTGK